MGFFKDLLKEAVDSATGGAISSMEADSAIRQLEQLERNTREFNNWFQEHSKNYIAIRDALNSGSYQVDRKIFHANWFTGKAEYDGKRIYEEDNENERRKNLLEKNLKELSLDHSKKLFRRYLADTEKSILDSYNVFRDFKNEMSYLPAFQKEIADSLYLSEIKELLGHGGSEPALKKISDFTWQIQKHKTPAGHAIVLLSLAESVYYEDSGFSRDIKEEITKTLLLAEDIVIDNTCASFLPEDSENLNAEELLQAGKNAFIGGEPEKAFSCYLNSAKKGNTEAQYRAGLCFEKGYGIFENRERAICWYKKSAESEEPVSKYYLATVYHWLLDESNCDYTKALELYNEAFDSGVAEAAENIGNMYADGKGVKKSHSTAVKWYKKGAASGSPWAMFHLYLAYLNGKGVKSNIETAAEWFDKCVKFFDTPDMEDSEDISSESEYRNDRLLLPGCDSIFVSIGGVYYNGNDAVAKDTYEAIEWFKKGAAIGSSNALDWLAFIYSDKGWYSDAAEYARKAAELWHPTSLNRYGLRCYNGEGTTKDKVIADIWFLKSAKAGYSGGQYNIADSFLKGETGVPKNNKEARYWLEKSAAQGYESAIKKLDELNEQDNQQQREVLAKKKANLKKSKNALLGKLANLDKKIDDAQTPQEEQQYIDEKKPIEEEIAMLDMQLNELE